MIDIGGNDRPPAGDFVAHEFRRDELGDRRAETVAGMGAAMTVALKSLLPSEIFPNRDVLHLRRDNALPGVMHLRNIATRFSAQDRPPRAVGKPLRLRIARLAIFLNRRLIARTGQFLDIAAPADPIEAHRL